MAPPIARRAPYKDFLQPALQRRFAGTAAIVLGLAYIESLTLSSWGSLIWAWLPLGLPGLRALAIFLCVLPIIVLRIAHSHMGIRTSNSIFETLANTVLPFSTFETLLTYVISALLFSQVYLKSTPEEAGIRWISNATGRSRLNEHAVFYTTNLALLGLIQGVLHVALDQDRLLLGTVQTERGRENNDVDEKPSPEHWAVKIGEWVPILVVRCGMLAITVAIINYTVLYHFLRLSAWRSSMWFFRFLYSDLPRYNLPPGNAPWSVWMLGRTIWASFLLAFLWYLGDVAFRVQLTREPLKKEQPLSAESKDPNGSLLNGLKSTKPRVSAFATWELAFITRDFTARRLSIFEDIDRKDGPMWSQVYALCIDNIKSIERKIDDYGKPPAPMPVTEPESAPQQPRARISQPIRTNDVSVPRPAAKAALVRDTVSKVITSPGKTPLESWVPKFKKGAVLVADQVMTREQKEAIQPEALRGRLDTLLLQMLALPVIGPIFQQTFGRQLAKAVLGSPYAETSVYINSAYALSHLAVCSLTEDKYGNVHRDVATIIRTFTVVIKKLETFRDEFPTHWTDISQRRQCPEVTEVLTALKGGLGALVEAFSVYSTDLRLSRADMRLAREAAEIRQGGRQPEMQQLG
ncbi:nucleoporin protein Ndc1-Nup [Hypoxylon argillaceum]|nr:nucleoporin protein Ndc1-Nup [Hypoxylon argillaceum]